MTNLSFKLYKPMRKFSSLILMLMVLGLTSVSAQKSKVTTGALNFDQGRYEDAIIALETGLADPSQFKKAKDLAKGYFYLAKAYYMSLGDTTLTAKFPNAALKAKEAYDNLQETGEAGKSWQNRATLENLAGNIWAQLYNNGVQLFNNNEDEPALQHFEEAVELQPDHFLTNRMLASAYLVLEDTGKTVTFMEKAVEVYKNNYTTLTPEELATNLEDPSYKAMYELDQSQLSYVIRQLAVIQEATNNTQGALATLTTGSELLPEDGDISRQELAIYQAHPDLFDQAVEKFEAQIESNPDDNTIRLAFASMLERAGKIDEALAQYQVAYDNDNESLQANYGLAAMRINKAAVLSEAKMESNDDAEIDRINEEIKALCEEAYPYLVWLHNEQPDEPEWVSQLVNITPIIGKNDEMMQWAEKLGEMRRGGN